MLLVSFFLLAVLVCVKSLRLPTFIAIGRYGRSSGVSLTRAEMVPQIIFAAGCAGAVFNYVYNNIDEIKIKQEIAVKATLEKQSEDLAQTKSKQRAEIDRVQREQRATLDKLAADAQARADAFKKNK